MLANPVLYFIYLGKQSQEFPKKIALWSLYLVAVTRKVTTHELMPAICIAKSYTVWLGTPDL